MTSYRSLIAVLLAAIAPNAATAQEPAACLSPDVAAWPQPAKPYVMIVADTSGSLTALVGNPAVASSCGLGSTRRDHLRCALRNAVTAYAGVASFGLATYATQQSGCDAACGTCVQSDLPGGGFGCGPGSGATRAGANIVVPLAQDSFWSATPLGPSNAPQLLSWFDGDCTGNTELYANGQTPLNGVLRDMQRYFSSQWSRPGGGATFTTPLVGTSVGEKACRSVNVVLITDSDENCDTIADAVAVATQMNAGVTVGGVTFRVRTHVINFAGGSQAPADQIAAAGGTGSALFAANEVALTQTLTSIVTGTLGPAETCDNVDNDCNGCTDEGFRHYCNVQPTPGQCCTGPRATCLASYQASITPANPQGNKTLLPCTTVAQFTQPATWLCYEPTDVCDDVDNDCQDAIDEGIVKVGNPPACP